MISIIITSYNYQKYIERAIRSTLKQSVPKDEYEILVINDASTDSTKEILENYKDDVRVVHIEKNVGLAAARNVPARWFSHRKYYKGVGHRQEQKSKQFFGRGFFGKVKI
jgi:glycosyltransferase involved in cell wall biosynthesis